MTAIPIVLSGFPLAIIGGGETAEFVGLRPTAYRPNRFGDGGEGATLPLRPHGPHGFAGIGAVRAVGVGSTARLRRWLRALWLPASIAKGASARWVYAPPSLLSDLNSYLEIDRAEVVTDA